MYIVPWNKFTYPFLALYFGFRYTKGANLKLIKLILEQIKYSLSLDKLSLPNISLRKLVNITGDDAKLRMGRW